MLLIQGLTNTQPELRQIAQYYFNGEGKAIRPVITMCMARAINYHLDQNAPFVIYIDRKPAAKLILNVFVLIGV